jgi:hypothetical protein
LRRKIGALVGFGDCESSRMKTQQIEVYLPSIRQAEFRLHSQPPLIAIDCIRQSTQV